MFTWNVTQAILGFIIFAYGLLVVRARKNPETKKWIEENILGVPDLFDPNAPFAPAVNFAGWKSLATAIGIAIPFPILRLDTLFLLLGVAVIAWVVLRVRREYRLAKKVVDGDGESPASA